MRILIVEDEPMQNQILQGFLQKQGFEVVTANNGHQALKRFLETPVQLILLDHNMPDMNGTQVLDEINKINPIVKTIIITAYGSVRTAVDVMKRGAEDFIEKPVDLMLLLRKVKEVEMNINVDEEANEVHDKIKEIRLPLNIVGNGPHMRTIFSLIQRVAPTPWNVMIKGETGTGKELIARMIHALSPRQNGPFIEVNCAAVPDNLFESELFGHEKGAFTGATERRRGNFEIAHNGTIFLDEIGEIPLKLQAKLLRVLQSGRVRRVGGENEFTFDVRVVAATNKRLKTMVLDGEFREDLFYRLNVLDIELPPLRERKEDIPDLITFFLDKYSQNAMQFSQDAMTLLLKYDYPGNVRELKHIIQRAVTLSRGAIITEDELPAEIRFYQGELQFTLTERLASVERQILISALENSGGVKTKAADALGVSERVLRYKINKHNIKLH